MALRKMTFDVPEELALRLEIEVPGPERSDVVVRSLRRRISRPRLTEKQWAAVCEAANNDPETRAIQAEFDALPDTMTEAWDDESVAG